MPNPKRKTRRKRKRKLLLNPLQLPNLTLRQLQLKVENLIQKVLNQQLKLRFLRMRKMRDKYRLARLSLSESSTYMLTFYFKEPKTLKMLLLVLT